MSERDIGAGARWGDAVSRELEATRFGVVCVTVENVSVPWLHFEAGALAKQVKNDTFVCPYLLGLQPEQVPQGPLSQFQMKQADRQGTLAIMETLNGALGEAQLPTERLHRVFGLAWPTLEGTLARVPEAAAVRQDRTTEDMIREILDIARSLNRRVPAPRNPLRAAFEGEASSFADLKLDAISRLLTSPATETIAGTALACAICGKPVSIGDYARRSSDSAIVHRSCHEAGRAD